MSRLRGLVVDFGGVLTNPLHGVMRDFCRAEGLADDALVELFTRDSRGRAAFADLERGEITQGEWEAVTAGLLGVAADGLLRRVLATLAPAAEMLDAVAVARAAGYATECLTNSFGLTPYDPYARGSLRSGSTWWSSPSRRSCANPSPRSTGAPLSASVPAESASTSTTSKPTSPPPATWA